MLFSYNKQNTMDRDIILTNSTNEDEYVFTQQNKVDTSFLDFLDGGIGKSDYNLFGDSVQDISLFQSHNSLIYSRYEVNKKRSVKKSPLKSVVTNISPTANQKVNKPCLREKNIKKIRKKTFKVKKTHKRDNKSKPAEPTITLTSKARKELEKHFFESEDEDLTHYHPLGHIYKPYIVFSEESSLNTFHSNLNCLNLQNISLNQFVSKSNEIDPCQGVYKCKLCPKVFKSRNALGGHVSSGHKLVKNTSKQSYQCVSREIENKRLDYYKTI